LTIEIRGAIPEASRAAIGSHAYGCDICQEVCPWNVQPAADADATSAWLPRAAFDLPSLATLWRTPDSELRGAIKHSSMTRAGVKRLRRNVAVCAGATGDEAALTALEETQEPTVDDPLVAEHVTWALDRHG
jgi:epoxyqueuosine reductase